MAPFTIIYRVEKSTFALNDRIEDIMKLRFFNIFIIAIVAMSCDLSQDAYTLSEWEVVEYQGNIRISLAHPFNQQNNDYEILAATTMETYGMGVCVDHGEGVPCVIGGDGFFSTSLIYSDGERKFFKASSSALLEHGLVLHFVAFDENQTVLEERRVKFEQIDGGPPPQTLATPNATNPNASTPTPLPATTPVPTAGQADGNADVQRVAQQYCGECHSTYGSDPGSLRGTGATGMIQSGSMPRGQTMPDADKQILLNFLR
jgi:mono/diheme cytochrome c family protein